MSASITAQTSHNFKENFVAHFLGSAQRQEIALQALGAKTPISHMSDNYSVSRKFVYAQQERALKGSGKKLKRFRPKKFGDMVLGFRDRL